MPAFSEREYRFLQGSAARRGKALEWEKDFTRASALLNDRKQFVVRKAKR